MDALTLVLQAEGALAGLGDQINLFFLFSILNI
jgi:hypothetical protein